jgi:hypothetical protein
MMRLPFCAICEQVGVLHTGDTCVRCQAAVAALLYPDTRDHAIRAPLPLGVRVLRWLGRHAPG